MTDSQAKKSSGIFIPYGNGFVELTDTVENTSLNGIAQHLGYQIEQIYVYFGDFSDKNKIKQVVLEVFSKNIIYVYTDHTLTEINSKDVDYFLRDYSIAEIFD